MLLEQNDECMISRRCMSQEVLRQAQTTNQTTDEPKEVEPVLVGQLTT